MGLLHAQLHLLPHTHTVLGPISPDELKITQTHEHILVQCFPYLTKPNYTSEDTTNLEVKLDSLGKIRYYPWVLLQPVAPPAYALLSCIVTVEFHGPSVRCLVVV